MNQDERDERQIQFCLEYGNLMAQRELAPGEEWEAIVSIAMVKQLSTGGEGDEQGEN